ncbi:MAG: AMP-binding protein, partial [Microvirga sp.]
MAEFDIARTRKTLFGALLDARDSFGRNKVALEDLERQPITFGRLVLGSLVLGRKLASLTKEREPIGVLLPNVQAIAVTLFGLNAFGRVPAFLNFTAGLKNLRAACEVGEIGTIVTSRRFVEQGKLDDLIEALSEGRRILWLEDVRAEITSLDKLRGLVDSWIARRIHAGAKVQPDDPAVLLFTSGSEGVPKGVVLSNANLVANAYQVKALAGDVLKDDDVFFDPLPIFHSFGLTAGLLTAVLNGMKSVLYPSPLHYRQIP